MTDLERLAEQLYQLKLKYDRKLLEAQEQLKTVKGRRCHICFFRVSNEAVCCPECNIELKKE